MKNTVKKRRGFFIGAASVLCAAAISCGALFITGAAKNNGSAGSAVSSCQSDYPKLPDSTLLSVSSSLEDQIKTSALVVDATVKEVLPDETRTYTPESGTGVAILYSENDMSGSEYTVKPVILQINDTLKGKSADKEIKMYLTPAELSCSPDFKSGDRLMFMLTKYQEGFTSTTIQDAYYYIAADEKVYPAELTDKLKEYSGMGLQKFKQKIKSLV